MLIMLYIVVIEYMDIISIKIIFLTFLLLGFFFYWVFNFITLYHLTRFGIGVQPKRFAAVFLLGSMTLFFVCVLILANIDINNIFNLINK